MAMSSGDSIAWRIPRTFEVGDINVTELTIAQLMDGRLMITGEVEVAGETIRLSGSPTMKDDQGVALADFDLIRGYAIMIRLAGNLGNGEWITPNGEPVRSIEVDLTAGRGQGDDVIWDNDSTVTAVAGETFGPGLPNLLHGILMVIGVVGIGAIGYSYYSANAHKSS